MDVSQSKRVQKSFTDSVVGITHRHTDLYLIKQISKHLISTPTNAHT